MIDFYKHSILSVLGRDAGTMKEIKFLKKINNEYDEYLKRLKQKKKEIEENGGNNNTEIYL